MGRGIGELSEIETDSSSPFGLLGMTPNGVDFYSDQIILKKGERAQHGSVVVSHKGKAGFLKIPTRRRITKPLIWAVGWVLSARSMLTL